MARRIVNEKWMEKMRERILTMLPHSLEPIDHIDEHISFNKSAAWLITQLSKNGIPFKVYNLGAGVKRITTFEPDKCPCCKRRY